MRAISILLFFVLLVQLNMHAQQSMSLNEAIQYGLENHNRLKLDALDEQKAEWSITEFKSIGMPKLNAGINYQYYFVTPAQPVEDFISPSVYGVLFTEQVIPQKELPTPETFEFSFFLKNNLSGNIELSSLVFDASYLYGLKAARLYRELVGQQKNTTAFEIKSNIIKAYLSILIAEENMKIVDDNIKTLNTSLKEITEIYKSGFIESLDVDRISLSLENTLAEKENLTQLIQIGYNVLKFQMSYPLNEDLSLSEDLKMIASKISMDEVAFDAEIDFYKRPDYQAIETGQKLNELNYKSTKSTFLPSARAFVSLSESLQRNSLFDNNEAGFLPSASAGLAINIPIYDGRERKSKMAQIKLEMEKTEIQKLEFENAIRLEVENAKLNFKNAKNTLNQRNKVVELNQNIYNKSLIKFKEGVGSSFEVTEAEASLYQAQASYINAMYELVNAKMNLDIAYGNI